MKVVWNKKGSFIIFGFDFTCKWMVLAADFCIFATNV